MAGAITRPSAMLPALERARREGKRVRIRHTSAVGPRDQVVRVEAIRAQGQTTMVFVTDPIPEEGRALRFDQLLAVAPA